VSKLTILLKMNLHCNFACKYCYENPIKPGFMEEIDLDAAEDTVRRIYEDYKGKNRTPTITLHGGEPTTYPKPVIDRLLSFSHKMTGRSGIQTNGYAIDDDLIEMFLKYDTGVGVSIDGPWPLNELRGIGSREDRIQQTAQILRNIDKMLDAGVRVSIIAVIHKYNAMGERREMLKQWLRQLSSKRISGRLNPCCSKDPTIDLTPEEAVEVYTDLLSFMLEEGITGWSPFKDIINSLAGNPNVVCVFKDCDPFCTRSAHTILKDGSEGVCLRLYMDESGRMYLRDKQEINVRSEILRQTDCKDCKWWEHCKGGCSGLSIDFDWRNKDRYCLMYKALFERISNAMKVLEVKKPKSIAQGGSTQGGSTGGHWDGIEHSDGDERHLDSDTRQEDHVDGITHTDGGTIHQDGEVHEDC